MNLIPVSEGFFHCQTKNKLAAILSGVLFIQSDTVSEIESKSVHLPSDLRGSRPLSFSNSAAEQRCENLPVATLKRINEQQCYGHSDQKQIQAFLLHHHTGEKSRIGRALGTILALVAGEIIPIRLSKIFAQLLSQYCGRKRFLRKSGNFFSELRIPEHTTL